MIDRNVWYYKVIVHRKIREKGRGLHRVELFKQIYFFQQSEKQVFLPVLVPFVSNKNSPENHHGAFGGVSCIKYVLLMLLQPFGYRYPLQYDNR